jgi:hypothetical protein
LPGCHGRLSIRRPGGKFEESKLANVQPLQARLAKCDNEQARAQQQKAGHN